MAERGVKKAIGKTPGAVATHGGEMGTRIIAVVNQKGGVGKTTSAVNLGYGLTKLGKRVMLVDLDPQANLTTSVGIPAHELVHTVFDVLKGTKAATDVIVEKRGVHVLPASLDLAAAESELAGVAGREFLLREAISDLTDKFDFVLLDCPPSLGLLTLNALTTSNEVFVTLQCEFLALQGVKKLIETVEVVKRRLNKRLDITGIVGTLFDSRRRLNKEVIERIDAHFGNKRFRTMIRDNVSLAEAPSHGLDIFHYKADSFGAHDYLELCREVLKQKGTAK